MRSLRASTRWWRSRWPPWRRRSISGRAPAELGLAKAASIERHGGPGTIGLGFVRGLGLRRGAVATSLAHDNHNLLVAGMSDEEMVFAVEQLRAAGGGMIAVAEGEVL